MTTIVTDVAGFIGSNLIFNMLKKHPEYSIIYLDKLTCSKNMPITALVIDNTYFRFVKADICDREALFKLFDIS